MLLERASRRPNSGGRGKPGRRRGEPRPGYYGRPALKPAPWGLLVSSYIFLAGLGGAAQVLSLLARLSGGERRKSVVRNGRYLAAVATLTGAPLLIQHLKTPQRWYNMLRTFRMASPMSMGSYLLSAFGGLSTLSALGQAFSRNRRFGTIARRTADAAQFPAAAIGAGMSSYTAALLAATSTPLWSSTPRLLALRFTASSIASGAAALSLAERRAGDPENCRDLDRIAATATLASLGASLASSHAYKQDGLDGVVKAKGRQRRQQAASYILGHGLPLALHAVNMTRREPSAGLSILASASSLAGSLITRHEVMEGGLASAERAGDSLRYMDGRKRQGRW